MKTALQIAIKDVLAKKTKLRNQYLQETSQSGRDQIAQTQKGLSMALVTLRSLRSVEEAQIKRDYESGFIEMYGNSRLKKELTPKWKESMNEKFKKYYSQAYSTE